MESNPRPDGFRATQPKGPSMSNEQEIEKEIQIKGLNAPRLSPDLIDGVIESEQYHVFEPSMKTVCCLTLRNGFTVIGEAGVVSRENFNLDIGMKVARTNAREKIWQLEGYLLKQRIHDAK